MSIQSIMKIVPTLQSVALAENAYKLVKKKRKKTKDYIDTGTQSIFGAALVQEQSKLVEDF